MNAGLKVRLAQVAALVLVSGFVAGCGSEGAGGFGVQDIAIAEDMAPFYDPEFLSAEGSDGGAYDFEDDAVSLDRESTVIQSATATVRTSKPEEASRTFAAQVEAMGGEITATYNSQWDDYNSATIEAQIPPEKLGEALDQLTSLGKVVDQSVNRNDVGLELADLTARKEALEASITRLKELQATAETTQELLLAEESLTRRQGDLDSLNSQLDWLSRQVSMSSLFVTFSQAPSGDSGFSWGQAWRLLQRSVEVVAYALVLLLPWAAVVTGLVLGVRQLQRHRKRRVGQRVGPGSETAESESPDANPSEDQRKSSSSK